MIFRFWGQVALVDLPSRWDCTAYGRRNNKKVNFMPRNTTHTVSEQLQSRYVPVKAENVIPEHCVLSIIRLRDTMMNIVGLGIKNGQATQSKDHVVPSMIQPGHKAPDSQKQDGRDHVHGYEKGGRQIERPQVIVFAQKEFQWMHVNGVHIGTARSLLMMMMFVYIDVDTFNV